MFDAFDHSLSYSIDLKNGGLYGEDSSEQVLKDNLGAAISACVQSAEVLQIPLEVTLSNISERIIGNFLTNPKGITSWGGTATDWLESLSHIFISSSLSSSLINDTLDITSKGSAAFTEAVLGLYELDPNNNDLRSLNIYPGIEPVSNNPSKTNQVMLFDGKDDGYYKFDPLKAKILESSTNGLIKATTQNALIKSNLDLENSENLVEGTINSISNSYLNFIKQQEGDHSMFAYELSRSFALGSASAIVSSAEELAERSEVFTVESFIEYATSEISKATILNSIDLPNISLPILAEAIANGTALGIQLPTIIKNQSLEDKFAGINRDIYAKYSSKGVAKGTIQTVSLNIDRLTTNLNLQPDAMISEIARHSAKGSV